MTSREYKWDDYAREAEVAPFVLRVSEDEAITIQNPTGVQIMRLGQGLRAGDLDLMLFALTGDSHTDITRLLGKVGHKALPKLIEDLMDHFGLYEDVDLRGPSGGVVTERRPDKIRALVRAGYKPLGED